MSCATFIEVNALRLRRIVDVVAARYRLRGPDREDLFQETIIRLYARYDAIDSAAAAFAYVESIADRLVLDARRRTVRRNEAWLGRVHRHHAVEPTDPADAAVRRARVSCVHRALTRLPVRERRAVELAEFAELSTVDGARVMQITPNAFKGLVQRGRQRLRVHLRDAPVVLFPFRATRRPPASVSPVRHAASGFVGVAAWCVMLVRPDVATLPHITALAAAPIDVAHGAPAISIQSSREN